MFPLADQSLVVKARAEQKFFGAPIGILLLDDAAPMIPGSMGHAGTFSQPPRYRTMPGVTFERIMGPDAAECEPDFVAAAVALANEGAEMITSNCGFNARFQHAVSAAVDVPVLLSSLLLAPFLESMLPKGKTLGIMAALSAKRITAEFLAAANLAPCSDRIVVGGLEGASEWKRFFREWETDFSEISSEVAEAARAFVRRRPDIGILLLECSELPPYAAAVQRATGLPVFDFTSMIEFFVAGLRRTPFGG